ncbi:hypothetical protein D3C87_1562100 [compost metagenome]
MMSPRFASRSRLSDWRSAAMLTAGIPQSVASIARLYVNCSSMLAGLKVIVSSFEVTDDTGLFSVFFVQATSNKIAIIKMRSFFITFLVYLV